ncbi:MAG TPA: hypothetical protein VKD91_13025 [Pyrinomonadaceae bacterium]|nr:hypothetical protein [Pyrinomonadaceae bacterium]
MKAFLLRLSVALLTGLLGIGSSWLVKALTKAFSPRVDTRIEIKLIEPPDERRIAAESKAVYQFVLEEIFVKDGANLLVIEDHTTGCPAYEDPRLFDELTSGRETFFDVVSQSIPEAQPATLRSYYEQNRIPRKLKPELHLSTHYALVSAAEMDQFFGKDARGRGWQAFYSRYPKSPGLIFMSAVGFNSSYDEAMLYIGHQCGGLCGSGEYLLLRQTEDRWHIVDRKPLWIS